MHEYGDAKGMPRDGSRDEMSTVEPVVTDAKSARENLLRRNKKLNYVSRNAQSKTGASATADPDVNKLK